MFVELIDFPRNCYICNEEDLSLLQIESCIIPKELSQYNIIGKFNGEYVIICNLVNPGTILYYDTKYLKLE